jgi:hypothetical protein
MQAFTDLVGTATLPAHAFDVAELTELTPTLDIAMAAHGTADQASEASSSTMATPGCFN